MIKMVVKEGKKGKVAFHEKECFLVDWINEKMKKEGWRSYGVSKTKYEISFIPLFSRRVFYWKDQAKNFGVSFGVMRKFLSENKVKKLVSDHKEEFAKVFFDRLVEAGENSLNPKIGVKKSLENETIFSNLIDEAITIYSDTLVFGLFMIANESMTHHYSVAASLLYNKLLEKMSEITKDGTYGNKFYLMVCVLRLRVYLIHTFSALRTFNDEKKKRINQFLQWQIDDSIKSTKDACELSNEILNTIYKLK